MSQKLTKRGSVFSAALLVAGNCIGTGFFAIPVMTGPSGALPGIVVGLVVWLYLVAAGLLYLEAVLASPDGANMVTICRSLIGPAGVILGVICFVVINYYFLSSFYAVGVEFFSQVCSEEYHLSIPTFVFHFALTLIFGGAVYLGVFFSDRFNYILFAGLCFSFACTIWMGSHNVKLHYLIRGNWYLVFFAVPVLLSAFDYQSILPTMATYLKRDPKKLFRMVIIAMLFPLIIYSVWQWFVIGSTRSALLWEAYETGKPIYEGLLLLKEQPFFKLMFRHISIFAIASSLLGVGLSVVDFLGDGFKIPVQERRGLKRLYLCLLVFIPAQLISFFTSVLFLESASYLVGWAEIIFNGILPIWLVKQARYTLKLPTHQFVRGGGLVLFILGVVTFFFIYLEGVELIRARL